MRIFISHATKNKEVVLKFAEFLESVSSEIEVFCSSENGSIKVGKDFIKTIFEELNSSVIIPGISEPPVRTLRATIPENERHIFR